MTYLVLARKWRPRSFDTLIGQDHVVRALTHALQTGRLHHAWLFTGTRGVGKTTLSRLLAKSLNCETGITATPCGTCRACVEIDQGRFVDYVELDAASNRGVDEMTQLLEQAVYAPGAGRFKVYMIDEVHMLTGHAFNAMLKTLEEPPAHVKFILATTDPQKIPVTVLSRCLQFNLKQMTADAIVGHLQGVLQQESIGFEIPALRLIAQAAAGSMRDALSLTDQAIAYSAGLLSAEAVRGMLGTIDQRYLVRLLQGLASASGQTVLQVADELATRGLSYSGALGDLCVLLSRIAIEQRVAGATPPDDPVAADIIQLAQQLPPDLVQLFYTVAVHSRSELSLAPDEYAGFVMACLRMLSLAPPPPDDGSRNPVSSSSKAPAGDPSGSVPVAQLPATSAPVTAVDVTVASAPAVEKAAAPALVPPPAPAAETRSVPVTVPDVVAPASVPDAAPDAPLAITSAPDPVSSSSGSSGPMASVPSDKPETPRLSDDDIPPWEDIPDDISGYVPDSSGAWVDDDDWNDGGFETMGSPGSGDTDAVPELSMGVADDAIAESVRATLGAVDSPERPRSARLRDMDSKSWPALAARLPATGVAAELARQSEWVGVNGNEVHLRVAIRLLAESQGKARLCTLLSEHFGTVVSLKVDYGVTGDETAHAVAQAERAERQRQAEAAVASDPVIAGLATDFGATVIPGSIRPLGDPLAA